MDDGVLPARPSLRASVLTAAAGGMLQLTGLLVFAILSRRLPPEELGAYRQFLILQSVPSILLAMGMPAAMLYRMGRADADGKRSEAYGAALSWLVLSTPPLALVTAGTVLAGARVFESSTLGRVALVAGLAGGAGVYAHYASPVFLSAGAPARYLGFSLAYTLLLCGVTATLVSVDPHLEAALRAMAFCGTGAWVVVAGTLAAGAARSGIGGRGSEGRWSVGSRLRELPLRLREMLGYGAPIAVGSCLYLLAYQMDHLVAGRLFSEREYALYAAGAWQLPIGPLVQQAQADVLLPSMSGHHAGERRSEFWSEWRRLIGPWGVLGALLFWAVFPVAEDIVRAALGSGYSGGAAVFRVYSLMLPLRMAAYSLPLRAAGATRWDVGASLAFLGVNLGAGLLLAPRLGLVGPAVGVLLGYGAWVGVTLLGTRRVLGTGIRTILPLGPVLISLALAGAAAGAAFLVAAHAAPQPGLARLTWFWSAYALLASALLGALRRGVRQKLVR